MGDARGADRLEIGRPAGPAALAVSARTAHCIGMRGGKITGGVGVGALAIASVAALASLSASPSAARAQSAADAGAAPASLPACVGVATEARYVPYGYNHVVVLKNGCSKPATCNVSTDVN